MKTEEVMLAECRAHWEATKPESVFADYWLGWKAARESAELSLPEHWDCGAGGQVWAVQEVLDAAASVGVKVRIKM